MKKFTKKTLSTFLSFAFLTSTFISPSFTKAKAIENNDREKQIKEIFIKHAKEKMKSTKTKNKTKNPDEKIRVIVQMKQKPSIESGKSISSIKNSQEEIKNQIEKLQGAELRQTYGYLVNGFSANVKRADIDKIMDMPGVKSVTEVRRYYPAMSAAKQLTQVLSVWKDYGYKGEGMVVSIIDTGIDVNHKDMRLSDASKAKIKEIKNSKETTFTTKVPYGRNFADNNDNVKDADTKSMHGMHVAGIVGANGIDSEVDTYKAIKGIAPEAQLLAMKVFSNNPEIKGCYDDDIIAAIEDSVLHGADVINMSLGSDNGFQDENDPQQVAIRNATNKGVLVVVAAGNAALSSTSNDWSIPPKNDMELKDSASVGSPSTAKDCLAVASFENTNKTVSLAKYTANSSTKDIHYIMGSGSLSNLKDSYEFVDCGLGKDEDFKNKNLNGKIALIERGDIPFSEKVANAKQTGAVAVAIYNSESGGDSVFAMGGLDGESFPSIACGRVFGLAIKEGIKNNGKIKFGNDMTLEENPSSGDMSPFTSWGPTPDLELKPEVSAPGGNIYSTINNNNYENMSGTSMATPYVSGAEALIIEALKKNTSLSGRALVETAKHSITNTATYLNDKNFGNGEIPYSPRRQGSGLIQIKNAIDNKVVVLDDRNNPLAALKEIGKETTFNLNLKNYGKEPVNYTIETTKVLTEKIMNENKNIADAAIENATITPNIKEIKIPAGSTAKVSFTVKLPENLKKNNFVEGYVTFRDITGKNPKLNVPYVGFYGDWSEESSIDMPIWESNSYYKKTGLMWGSGSYLGGTFDKYKFQEVVNPENAVISPNDDTHFDRAIPMIALKRNVKTLTLDLVDRNDGKEKLLRRISTENNVSKPLATEINELNPIFSGTWDGQVYDASTGNFKNIEDGQYYIRIGATLYSKNQKPQYIYMPIKVDTKKPEINIISLKKLESNKYEIIWSEKDAFSGVDDDNRHILLNDEIVDNDFPIEKVSDNTFKCVFQTKNDSLRNWVTVGALDRGFNAGTQTRILDNNIAIHKVKNGDLINKSKLNEDGTFTILGRVSPVVKELKINNVEVNISSEDFEVNIPLNEGENNINAVAKDATGTIINNETLLKLYLDSKAPSLEITSPVLGENNLIKSDSDKVIIKGKIKDETSKPEKCSVNVGYILGKVNADGTFESEIKIPWDREINVKARDEAGNETSQTIKVVYENPNEDFKVYFSNLSSLNFISPKDVDVKNDIYTIKGRVNKKIASFTIAGEEVKLNEDLSFNHKIKLNQACNKLNVVAKDKNGKMYYNYAYSIWYDSIKPTLSISDPIESVDGKVYTNKDQITIKGTASDNIVGYTLKVNGSSILRISSLANSGNKITERTFEYTLDVKTGDTIALNIEDEFGNALDKNFKVVVDKIAPVISIGNIENDKTYDKAVIPSIKVDDKTASVQMQLNGVPYKGESISKPGLYKLEVKAVDLAGNVTVKSVSFQITEKKLTNNDNTGKDNTSNKSKNNTTANNSSNKNSKISNKKGILPKSGSPINLATSLVAALLLIGSGTLLLKRKNGLKIINIRKNHK